MGMEVERREIDGIVILGLDGRLVLGPAVSQVQKELDDLLAKGQTRAILDLKRVPFIDSSGLGTLVAGHSAFEKAGGAMRLLHVSQRNIELLVLTKLSTVFHCFDDEQAAIDSFFPEREAKRFDILEFVKSQDTTDTSNGS